MILIKTLKHFYTLQLFYSDFSRAAITLALIRSTLDFPFSIKEKDIWGGGGVAAVLNVQSLQWKFSNR